MGKDHSFLKYDLIVWGLFLCFAVFLFVSSGSDVRFVPFRSSDLTDFSEGWTDGQGRQISLMRLHSDGTPAEDGSILVSRLLPSSIPQGADLMFRSKNINFSVLLDGKTVYKFYPKLGYLAGKSYGSCFHHIAIPPEDAGKTISLSAQPIYADNSGFFNFMALGNSGAYYQEFLQGHLLSFIICVITMVFGALMLLLALTLRQTLSIHLDLPALGMLALMLGGWSCMETLVPQLLVGSGIFFHGINYLLLILMPYPGMQLINSMMVQPKKAYSRAMLLVVCADLAVCTVLNYTNILDFHECLPLIHAVLIGSVVTFFVMFLRNVRYCRKNGIQHTDWLVLSAFVAFCVFCMLDLLRYSSSHNGINDAGFFMRVGLLAFILILFARSLQRIIHYMRLAGETEAVKRLAYTDALTGLANRTAFLKKEQELQTDAAAGRIGSVLVCQFDINDLKYVNDTYGHAYGDRHIRAAAEAILHAFGKEGNCYRIGGDEFTAFLTGQEEKPDLFDACLTALRQEESAYNRSAGVLVPLCISCGAAVFTGEDGATIEGTERLADRDMYRAKQAMKTAAAQS